MNNSKGSREEPWALPHSGVGEMRGGQMPSEKLGEWPPEPGAACKVKYRGPETDPWG